MFLSARFFSFEAHSFRLGFVLRHHGAVFWELAERRRGQKLARILFFIAVLYILVAIGMYIAQRRKLRRLLRTPGSQAVHIIEIDKENID